MPSPDGQTIAYSGDPGLDGAQLCALSLAGDIRQLDACVAGNTRSDWSSDSRWLAYIAQSSPDCEHDPDYRFAIVDAVTGEVRRHPGQPSPRPQDDPHWLS
ncbi:MAG: TolB family protein [Dehalococcoidia bacterium]